MKYDFMKEKKIVNKHQVTNYVYTWLPVISLLRVLKNKNSPKWLIQSVIKINTKNFAP